MKRTIDHWQERDGEYQKTITIPTPKADEGVKPTWSSIKQKSLCWRDNQATILIKKGFSLWEIGTRDCSGRTKVNLLFEVFCFDFDSFMCNYFNFKGKTFAGTSLMCVGGTGRGEKLFVHVSIFSYSLLITNRLVIEIVHIFSFCWAVVSVERQSLVLFQVPRSLVR